MTTIRHSLLPKQYDFVRSDAREVLYSGAYAAGKTRALCYRLVSRAQVVGSREGICRKHLVTLRASTLRTLLEPDGSAPAVLPPGTYEWNKSNRTMSVFRTACTRCVIPAHHPIGLLSGLGLRSGISQAMVVR